MEIMRRIGLLGMPRIANYSNLKKMCFIVGTGRCGTTILAQLLNSHSKIVVPPELQILDKITDKNIKKCTPDVIVKLVDEYCPYRLQEYVDYKRYLMELRWPLSSPTDFWGGLFDYICREFGKEIFIEQTPWHGLMLPMLKKMFPQMLVIHIIRDPRDVAISFIKSRWWGDISLDDAVYKWANIVSQISNFGKNIKNQYIELKYEDLVANASCELNKITNFIGVEYENAMLNLDNMINYRKYQVMNALPLQSVEYQKWYSSNSSTLFSDNVYGWKRKDEYNFDKCIPRVAKVVRRFGYEL